MRHKEQKGYLTIAQNGKVDYLRLAYLQALSIKASQRINKYAVIVDEYTESQITDKHREVFDYIITLPFDMAENDDWKLANNAQIWALTPFKETVSLDADILFTRDISHWWYGFQEHDVCITTNVRDFRGNVSTSRKYRRVFDDNNLLNTYNGFTYFRFSETSMKFYKWVDRIFKNWPEYRDKTLKNCRIEKPTTDEVYALASLHIGEELCYNPSWSFPTFTHMKPAINGWDENLDWRDAVSWTLTEEMDLIVGGYYQHYPLHYNVKDFATDGLIDRYENDTRREKNI